MFCAHCTFPCTCTYPIITVENGDNADGQKGELDIILIEHQMSRIKIHLKYSMFKKRSFEDKLNLCKAF